MISLAKFFDIDFIYVNLKYFYVVSSGCRTLNDTILYGVHRLFLRLNIDYLITFSEL